jgi:hypothetical protein
MTNLTEAGITASQLRAAGYGQQKPADNSNREGHAKNRRVELNLTCRARVPGRFLPEKRNDDAGSVGNENNDAVRSTRKFKMEPLY